MWNAGACRSRLDGVEQRLGTQREPILMVAVIEGREEAGGARYIEFKVHRSLTDPDRILGSWRYAHGESSLIDQSKLDSPVGVEFRHAVDCADQHGIPFVWVNDPDELFPTFMRR
jgi:hypothetical protein